VVELFLEDAMPTNFAAVLPSRFGDLEVRQTPFPTAGPGQLVIRNQFIAVNPLDVVKQVTGDLMYGWLPYPAVLGEDVAGEVVDIGSEVTGFRAGDRVIAYALGMEKGRNTSTEGGFQLYTVVDAALTASIPDTMAFEDAVVLPLAISTAASALFQQDQLALRHPTRPAHVVPTGMSADIVEWVVVWGGSTSVGSNAIQLAVAAGYKVLTTASPRNHDRLRALGADLTVDYSSPNAVAEIITALDGRPVAGILAIGTGSAAPCITIASRIKTKRVALASPSVSLQGLPRTKSLNPRRVMPIIELGLRTSTMLLRAKLHGIRAKFVWGASLRDNTIGPMLWKDFLPTALREGTHLPVPKPQIIGDGLEHVQAALDTLGKGVSARKLVIRLHP
jgi:NADPH:quinone reductase-like Zn-dependent oxidoreductase